MNHTGRVLVIDDEKDMCSLVEDMLGPKGFEVKTGKHLEDIIAQLDESGAEVLLTDLRMPKIDGLGLCRRIAESRPDVPVVVMTGFGSLETAVQAIRAGAYDFVTKPVEVDTLVMAMSRAVRHRRLEAEVRRLRSREAEPSGGAATIIGESDAMRRLRELVRQLADLDVTVLVTGESGTGKEVVARALHEESGRRLSPFVAINCAAVPEHLLESQLFGHVRGAFTDARSDRAGLFVQASGGTLFLDEIGEMPLSLQPKILRALQERVVRPVGSEKEVPFDARVLVATNKDLEAAVAAGRFRQDLYYRVNVVSIDLPPLRARGDDALALAQLFLARAAKRMSRPVRGISTGGAAAILGYEWPGNVRELQNAMERAVALTRYEEIVAADLPEPKGGSKGGPVSPAQGGDGVELISLDEVERRHVLAVLAAVGNSRKRASAVLGVDPKTLYRKLLQWGGDGARSA
jgi:DNA-binding NtrC family response regulator